MSLIAWYPLNGELTDHSSRLNPTTVNGSIVSNTAGKIGSTYDFSTGYLSLDTTNLMLHNDLTICFWIKPKVMPPSRTGVMETAYGAEIALNLVSDGSFQYYYGTSGIEAANYYTWYTVAVASLNVWTHIAMVRDVKNKFFYLYKDGNLVQTTAYSINPVKSTNHTLKIGYAYTGYLNGYLNDVRFYDNMLSTKEIKELAKAKVLHLTFNDFQEPTTNLYSDGNFASGATHAVQSLAAASGLILDNTEKFDRVLRFMPRAFNQYNGKDITVTVGTTYSASLWAYVSSDCDVTTVALYCENGYPYASYYNFAKKGEWQLLKTENKVATGVSARILAYVLSTFTKGHVLVTNYQLERKNYATEFTPTFRSAIARDISGYEHDGSIGELSSPKWVGGKLGSGSYYFDSSVSKYIDIKGLGSTTSLAGFTNATISFWRKNDATISSWLPFTGQTTSYYIMATLNGTGNFYHSNAGSAWSICKDGVNLGQTVAPFTDQAWHHYAIKNINISTWTTLNLGKYPGEWEIEGYFDDLRLYNTVLSDADIAELYQTRAQLDSNGNLFANEININGYSSDIKNLIEYPYWVQGTYGAGNNKTWYGETYNKAMTFNPIANDGVKIKIEPGTNPVGDVDVLAKFVCDVSNFTLNNHSGVYYDFNVDTSKAYRVSQWMYLHHAADTSIAQYNYFGITGNHVCACNSTGLNSNPYFTAPYMGSTKYMDNWLLQVFYIFPYGSVGNPTTGATYTTAGVSDTEGVNYNWAPNITSSQLRQYIMYEYEPLGAGSFVYQYRPRIDVVDGNEPTIAQLVKCTTHRPIIKDVSTNVWNLKNVAESGSVNFGGLSEVGITDGLVGYWKLNGNADDYSGNHYDASTVGATVTSGLKNLAYNFDVSSYRIITPLTATQHPNNYFTYSAWINRTVSVGVYNMFMGKLLPYFSFMSTGVLTLSALIAGTQRAVTGSTNTLVNNTWYHAVGTFDGTYLKVYLNGRLDGTSAAYPGNVQYSGYDLIIGDGQIAQWYPFNGKITDVRVYNRALSAEEINILYKQGIPLTGMQIAKNGMIYLNGEIKEGL